MGFEAEMVAPVLCFRDWRGDVIAVRVKDVVTATLDATGAEHSRASAEQPFVLELNIAHAGIGWTHHIRYASDETRQAQFAQVREAMGVEPVPMLKLGGLPGLTGVTRPRPPAPVDPTAPPSPAWPQGSPAAGENQVCGEPWEDDIHRHTCVLAVGHGDKDGSKHRCGCGAVQR
jgi:hypothetical protein